VTLLDDDNKPVGGQTVNWYVNNKKVASGKTAGNGTFTFNGVAGQSVYASFSAVANKYNQSKSATIKLV
jgi:hypothetical protein